MRATLTAGLRRAKSVVLVGPPSLQPQPTRLTRLFPWPVRLAAVVAAAAIGHTWWNASWARQLGGALQYGGLLAVSLSVSFWFWIFVPNFAVAVAWLVWPLRDAAESPRLATVQTVLTFVNRQIGHIETLAVWLVVAVVDADRLSIQLPFVVGVLLLGEPLINGLANRIIPPGPGRDLGWRRRPLFYVATAVGLLWIILLAPRQGLKLVPGTLALALADAARAWRHRIWSRGLATEGDAGPRALLHARQLGWAARWDALLVTAVLVLAVAVSEIGRAVYDARQPEVTYGQPVDVCTVTPPVRHDAAISLFIVSDSQFHELAGAPFVGQMAFAEALVPVARRPLELDVLSAAPLWQFADLRRRLERERGAPLPWVHLGDMADLSCQGEMSRAGALLQDRFGAGELVGVAPGNHDKAFTGNFIWSPYWDSACPSGRMEKPVSDRLLDATWRQGIERSRGRMQAVPPGDSVATLMTAKGGALITAAPLGKVPQGGADRGVIAVFLDTSDGRAFDLGVAGSFGAFSSAQAEAATQLAREVATAEGYDDPLYLVFMHHPLDEVWGPSGRRLRAWLAERDGATHKNLIGVVSAHTHLAQKHAHCIGGRVVPEIVVGSTIDPPQEAALLELGPTPGGDVALRLETLPAVARPSMACATGVPLVSARECQVVLGGLLADPACAPLFRREEVGSLGHDCTALEHPRDTEARLRQAMYWTGPDDEKSVRTDQREHMKRLLACVCRKPGVCAAEGAAALLDDQAYAAVVSEALRANARELTCLAWAGGAVQSYKSAGMEVADALRCAFDDDTLAPARDFVATTEVVACGE
jgi:hypothetical protein